MATQTTQTMAPPAKTKSTTSRKKSTTSRKRRKGDDRGDDNRNPPPKRLKPDDIPAVETQSFICDFCANHPEGQAAHAVNPCNRGHYFSSLLECKNCANYRARHRNSNDPAKAKHVCLSNGGTVKAERIYADSDPVAPPPAVCDYCHKKGYHQTCDVDPILEFGCSTCVGNECVKKCVVNGKVMDKRPIARTGDPKWYRHACDACAKDIRKAQIPCTWLNDRSTWEDRCNRCTADNRICLDASHLVADIQQPMNLPDTWEIQLTDDVPYIPALTTSQFRQVCVPCAGARIKCQVSSKTPHHACERCTQLGIDCVDTRNQFFPIFDLSRVGFGGSTPFQICKQCHENGRNCDHQRPCDSCTNTGNAEKCDSYDAKKKNTASNDDATFNCFPRFANSPGILYYLAMGYGPGGVGDRKSGSRIEEWIGPLASIYGGNNAKFLMNQTEQAARLARNAAQPAGNPPHGGPGGALVDIRPSRVTSQQLEAILRAANPSIVPPTAQQIAGAGSSAVLDESRILAESWVQANGKTPRQTRRPRRAAAPLISAVCPPPAPPRSRQQTPVAGVPFPIPHPSVPGQFVPMTAFYPPAPGEAPQFHATATYLANLLAQRPDPELRAIVQQEILEERQQKEAEEAQSQAQEAQSQAQEAAIAPPSAQIGDGNQSHVRAPSQNTQTAQDNPFNLRRYAPLIARPPATDSQAIWEPNVPSAHVPNNPGFATAPFQPPAQPQSGRTMPSQFGGEDIVLHDNSDLPQDLVNSMLSIGQQLQAEDAGLFPNFGNAQINPVHPEPPRIDQNDPRYDFSFGRRTAPPTINQINPGNDLSFSEMMQDAPNFMGDENVQNVQNAQGAGIDPGFVPFNDADVWNGASLFENIPAQAPQTAQATQTTEALPVDPALQTSNEDPNINSGLLQGNNTDQVMSNNVEDVDGPNTVSTNMTLNPFIGIDVTNTPDYRHPQLLTRWRDANRLEGLDMRHWQTEIAENSEPSRLFGTVAGQPVADAPSRDIVKDIPLQKDTTTINHEAMNFCMEPFDKGLGICFKNVPDLTGCQSSKHRYGRPPTHFLVCDDCNDESTNALVKGDNPITAKDIISLRAYLCTSCATHYGESPQNMSALRAAGAARVWGQYRNGEAPDGVFALPGGESIEYKRDELPATGCACATKVFDRRLCRFHRLFYAEQSLQQAALMQEWRLNRFGKAVCPACLLTKPAQDANVSADQGGFEESAVTAWACLSCNDWVVNQDNDSEEKPQIVPGYWREGTLNAQELFIKEDQQAGPDFDQEMADVFDM